MDGVFCSCICYVIPFLLGNFMLATEPISFYHSQLSECSVENGIILVQNVSCTVISSVGMPIAYRFLAFKL